MSKVRIPSTVFRVALLVLVAALIFAPSAFAKSGTTSTAAITAAG